MISYAPKWVHIAPHHLLTSAVFEDDSLDVNAISGKYRHFPQKYEVVYESKAKYSGFSRKTHAIFEKIVHCALSNYLRFGAKVEQMPIL